MNVLDSDFFDFDDPDGKQLFEKLQDFYYENDMVKPLLQEAGFTLADIPWEKVKTDLWRDVLPLAAEEGLLRNLVQEMRRSPLVQAQEHREFLAPFLQAFSYPFRYASAKEGVDP